MASCAALMILAGGADAASGAVVTSRVLMSGSERPLAVVFTANDAGRGEMLAGIGLKESALASLLVGRFAEVSDRLRGRVDWVLRSEINSYRPMVTGALGHVLCVSVEEFPKLAAAYDVTSLPAFLVIGVDGTVTARHEGVLDAAAWTAFLAANLPPLPVDEVRTEPAAVAAAAPISVSNLVTIPWTHQTPATPTEPPVELAQAATSGASASMPTTEPPTEGDGDGVEVSASETRAVTRGRFRPSGRHEKFLTRTFAEPTLWTIQLKTTSGAGDIDVEVQGPTGQSIELSENASGDEKIIFAAAPGVAYRIRVYSFRAVTERVAWRLTEKRAPLADNRIPPGGTYSDISIDNNARASVAPGRDTWIRFMPTTPGRYRFSLTGRGAAGVTAVAVNSAGQVIGRFQDGGVIASPEAPGHIYLRLGAENGNARRVNVAVAQFTEVDPASVSGELLLGTPATSSVGGSAGREKVYRFRVPHSGAYDLALRGVGATTADIDLEILKPTGELMERSEGPAATENLRRTLEAGEEYFVRVYAYRAERPVRFTLTAGPATGPVPNNGSDSADEHTTPSPEELRPPANAPVLSAGRKVNAEVQAGATVWYKFTPSTDGLVAIFLNGDESCGDIDLAIHKADGERIELSQTESPREALLIKVSAGEAIFVRVFAYGESRGGAYRVWLQVID